MTTLNKEVKQLPKRPIKIVQFGEGNFLRAFVDWMFQTLNNEELFDGNIAVVQPLEYGRIKQLNEQDGLYTVILEGISNNEFISTHDLIDVLSQFINPYEDYEAFLKLAELDSLEMIISNTTESGIVFDETDSIYLMPPKSFPCKLLAFLHHRYLYFNGDVSKGVYILPCELIDDNGAQLLEVVLKLAKKENLDEAFISWLNHSNTFISTLVDRIVPGYPASRVNEFTDKLGYTDQNLVLGEIFHLWVIENRNNIAKLFNSEKSELNIVFAEDIKPYKIQKVRLLNGLHTLMVPVAYFMYENTVGDAMKNETIKKYIDVAAFKEIIPATEQYINSSVLERYTSDIFARFNNPCIRHELLSIALNATAKFKSRLLPTALDYLKVNQTFPKAIFFSLASYLVFFRGIRNTEEIRLQDEVEFLTLYKELWSLYDGSKESIEEIVVRFLGLKSHWELDLNDIEGLTEFMVNSVECILNQSMNEAVQTIIKEG